MFRRAAQLATVLFAIGAAAAALLFAVVVGYRLHAAQANLAVVSLGMSVVQLVWLALAFWLLCFVASWSWLRFRGK